MAAASTGEDGWLLAHGCNLVAGEDNHPAALVRAGAMVLSSLGELNAAHALEEAVTSVLKAGEEPNSKFFDRVHQAATYNLHLMDVSNA
jgi:isocitrate/isopropylmalate dehydrogenase